MTVCLVGTNASLFLNVFQNHIGIGEDTSSGNIKSGLKFEAVFTLS